jgi:hypothetical protein
MTLIFTHDINGNIPTHLNSATAINPLDLIDDRYHNLKVIYDDMIDGDIGAKALMEYILFKLNDTSPLVFKVSKYILETDDDVVLVNSMLLSDNDISFLSSFSDRSIIVDSTNDYDIVGNITTGDVTIINKIDLGNLLNSI